MKGSEIAARACALVGARFRPQGRNAADGLDCVGAAALAAAIPADKVPRDYALRGHRLVDIERRLRELGCRPAAVDALKPGDLVLCRPGPEQFHLAVITASGFVHADAALRRVVERPCPIPWTVVSAWRLAEEEF